MQARKNLEIVRGTSEVDKEFADLAEAADLAMSVRYGSLQVARMHIDAIHSN